MQLQLAAPVAVVNRCNNRSWPGEARGTGTKFRGGVHRAAARGYLIWIHDAWTLAASRSLACSCRLHRKFLRDRRAAHLRSATRTRLGSAPAQTPGRG
jgi:hypothetical protein